MLFNYPRAFETSLTYVLAYHVEDSIGAVQELADAGANAIMRKIAVFRRPRGRAKLLPSLSHTLQQSSTQIQMLCKHQ